MSASMASAPVTALVLAGTRPGRPDPLAQMAGVSHKALLPIGGVPMVLRVIAALRDVPAISRIAVCVDSPHVLADKLPPDILLLPAQPGGPSASVLAGLARFGTPLLVTTADNALLQAAWVEEFLSAIQPQSDMAACVATQDAVQRAVPNTRRTYIRLADMTFSGCNMFLFKSAVSARVADLWQRVEQNRKNPLRVALALGPLVLLRALTGRLTRAALYRRIAKLTGAQAELVPLSDGRAAVDVDKPDDVVVAEQLAAALPPIHI
ncbi:nucleotidyltransferase family protein [Acetobacter papayae]|uniref:nucleotidyltransferase family protein n=1 Tax=Acetobacter papayae TaxID=1076592 RepID=UPI0039EA25E2